MYLLQIWLDPPDPAAEDAIYGRYAMCKLTGTGFMTGSVPGKTAPFKLRHFGRSERAGQAVF